jgi:hypothetical protein
MSFRVGQQVVCVNDKFSDDKYWRRTVLEFPKLRSVYTVREICDAGDLVGFCFHEIKNPIVLFTGGYFEPAFNVKNFRPVKKTSIEIFEKLLAPTNLLETV